LSFESTTPVKAWVSIKVYWDRKGVWGKGYFVSTVGINEEVIRRYVQSQEEEETGQAKLEF